MVSIPTCFAKGTFLSLVDGDVLVEQIQAGNMIRTFSGEVKKVLWVGMKTLEIDSGSEPDSNTPVLVSRDALAPGIPKRDVILSGGHCIVYNGQRKPVGRLVNNQTIKRYDCETVTYYHIEVDGPDYVLAEGIAAETYVDTGNRAQFDNFETWQSPDCDQIVLINKSY